MGRPWKEGLKGHRATLALQLAAGCLVGLLSFLVVVPGQAMRAGADGFAAHDDQLVHIASLRYFVWDEWRWPLMQAAGLGGDSGTVVVFTDSIPFYALGLRLARRAITPEFNFLGWWLALCYALQGLAAVTAVRMWGVARWAPCLAAAIFAASMPAWLARMVHGALCFHAPLLLACGLYGLAARWKPARLVLASLLLAWTALGVNVYLFVMVAVLTVALLARLWIGGWPIAKASVALVALAAGALLEMWALGFFAPHGIGPGFSFFSMNVLSPVYPPATALLGRLGGTLDATGGQYEGFNYLGLGLLALLPVALWLQRDRLRALAQGHRPLLIAGLALACFSLSNQIYLGDRLFLLLPPPPDFIAQFRAPGRFFWPVGYAILLACIVGVARQGKRFERVLIAAAILQWADAAGVRTATREVLKQPPALLLDQAAWVPLVAEHDRVVVAPSWDCAVGGQRRLVNEVVYLASIPRTAVSTVYSARPTPVSCDGQQAAFRAGAGVEHGSLVVALDGVVLPQRAAGWPCARFPGGRACSGLPEAGSLLRAVGEIEP